MYIYLLLLTDGHINRDGDEGSCRVRPPCSRPECVQRALMHLRQRCERKWNPGPEHSGPSLRIPFFFFSFCFIRSGNVLCCESSLDFYVLARVIMSCAIIDGSWWNIKQNSRDWVFAMCLESWRAKTGHRSQQMKEQQQKRRNRLTFCFHPNDSRIGSTSRIAETNHRRPPREAW